VDPGSGALIRKSSNQKPTERRGKRVRVGDIKAIKRGKKEKRKRHRKRDGDNSV